MRAGTTRRENEERPVRARIDTALRRLRATLMVDRRTQSVAAACLALVVSLAVHAMVTAPGNPGVSVNPSKPAPSVPADHRVVTIPAGGPLPGVGPGSRVDLVARSEVLVADVMVTGSGEGTVSVAVPAASAPELAEVASTGEVWVVLRP